LRERKEDICRSPDSLACAKNNAAARDGSDPRHDAEAAARALERYPWPGNVRELENAIERAMVLCEGDVLEVVDLPERVRDALDPVQVQLASGELSIKKTMHAVEQILIRRALQKTRGNRYGIDDL
jgi:two-component system response regulator AtoC